MAIAAGTSLTESVACESPRPTFRASSTDSTRRRRRQLCGTASSARIRLRSGSCRWRGAVRTLRVRRGEKPLRRIRRTRVPARAVSAQGHAQRAKVVRAPRIRRQENVVLPVAVRFVRFVACLACLADALRELTNRFWFSITITRRRLPAPYLVRILLVAPAVVTQRAKSVDVLVERLHARQLLLPRTHSVVLEFIQRIIRKRTRVVTGIPPIHDPRMVRQKKRVAARGAFPRPLLLRARKRRHVPRAEQRHEWMIRPRHRVFVIVFAEARRVRRSVRLDLRIQSPALEQLRDPRVVVRQLARAALDQPPDLRRPRRRRTGEPRRL
eukprot:28401-Pelagococcus_subviridis.AAC.5